MASFERLRVPTLLIRGERTREVTRRIVDLLHAAISQAALPRSRVQRKRRDCGPSGTRSLVAEASSLRPRPCRHYPVADALQHEVATGGGALQGLGLESHLLRARGHADAPGFHSRPAAYSSSCLGSPGEAFPELSRVSLIALPLAARALPDPHRPRGWCLCAHDAPIRRPALCGALR